MAESNFPVPDPTALTTAQLLRELSAAQQLEDARLAAIKDVLGRLIDEVNGMPAEVRTQIAHLQELEEEKFKGIARQFQERDDRVTQSAIASGKALEAALQAAKELVGAQSKAGADLIAASGKASAQATDKAEESFNKRIEAVATTITTLSTTVGSRLDEIKERLDKGSGGEQGRQQAGEDQRNVRVDQRSDQGLRLVVIGIVCSSIFSTLVIVTAILLHKP